MAKQVKDGEFISVLCDVFVGVAVVVQVSIVFFFFFALGGRGGVTGEESFSTECLATKGEIKLPEIVGLFCLYCLVGYLFQCSG